MTQMTTEDEPNNPAHPRLDVGEEPEDFIKVLKTDSGHLALVDASILRNSEHPKAKDAVIFATKQTPGEEVAFKVSGKYDDAILRNLQMEPADLEDVQKHEQQKANNQDAEETKEKLQQENVQLSGKGGANSAVRKGREIKNIGPGMNNGSRQNRNRQDSATKADPHPDPAKKIDQKMAERTSSKGAARGGFGQGQKGRDGARKNKNKKEIEVESFIRHLKNNTITIEFLNNMEYSSQIHEGFNKLRRNIMEGKSKGNLDLVHDACSVLNDHYNQKIPENLQLIENLLKEGIPLV